MFLRYPKSMVYHSFYLVLSHLHDPHPNLHPVERSHYKILQAHLKFISHILACISCISMFHALSCPSGGAWEAKKASKLSASLGRSSFRDLGIPRGDGYPYTPPFHQTGARKKSSQSFKGDEILWHHVLPGWWASEVARKLPPMIRAIKHGYCQIFPDMGIGWNWKAIRNQSHPAASSYPREVVLALSQRPCAKCAKFAIPCYCSGRHHDGSSHCNQHCLDRPRQRLGHLAKFQQMLHLWPEPKNNAACSHSVGSTSK